MTEQNNMTADERYCFDCIHNEVCRYCPREYCDYKEQACTLESPDADDWISVDDRLPPYGERVLVVNEAYETERGYTKYNYNCGVTVREPHLNFTFWGHKVTHWQPLPKPPKEGAK